MTEDRLNEQRAKEILEEQKKPKKVSRAIPIFIDIIILTIQFSIFCGYFYMALIYKRDTSIPDCRVDSTSNVPLTSSVQDGVNVTVKFRRAINWGLWMAFLTITRAILA